MIDVKKLIKGQEYDFTVLVENPLHELVERTYKAIYHGYYFCIHSEADVLAFIPVEKRIDHVHEFELSEVVKIC